MKQLENLITGREEKKRGFFLPNHCVYLGCACCHIPSMSRSYSRSPFSMSFLLRYLLFSPPLLLCVLGGRAPLGIGGKETPVDYGWCPGR